MRWLAPAGLCAIWLTAGVGAAAAQPAAAGRACDAPQVVSPAPAPAGSTDIVVPVRVHYMENRAIAASRPGRARDPETLFSRTRLADFLAADGEVNRILRPAGIRLVLQQFDRCRYSLPAFGAFDESDRIPSPHMDCDRAFFRKVNRRYVGGEVGLDLFVWWTFQEDLPGYGSPWVEAGPGAVWVRSTCDRRPGGRRGAGGAGCARLLAHEAGHFFGLCHVCGFVCPNTCPVAAPGCDDPAVARSVARRLMDPDFRGKGLTADEIETAKQGASKRALR